MKHIVVTGAAGFLGSHLVKSLIHQGHRVTGMDNLSTGVLRNLEEVMAHPRFEFHQADVTHPDSLEIFAEQQVHEIYHLASPASPKFYQADSIGTIWSEYPRNLSHAGAGQDEGRQVSVLKHK